MRYTFVSVKDVRSNVGRQRKIKTGKPTRLRIQAGRLGQETTETGSSDKKGGGPHATQLKRAGGKSQAAQTGPSLRVHRGGK